MHYSPCHLYQRDRARELGQPILNVACKEDPANLGGDFNATNIDIEDYDVEMRVDLYSAVRNFQKMSALHMDFPDATFAHVILGEFLEHCTEEAARRSLEETCRVLRQDGHVTLTFPRDHRTPAQQRTSNYLYEYTDGITTYHQTVWTDPMLLSVFERTGFREVSKYREEIPYDVCSLPGVPCVGCGIVLEKDR